MFYKSPNSVFLVGGSFEENYMQMYAVTVFTRTNYLEATTKDYFKKSIF